MEDQKVFSRMKSEIKRLAKKQEQAYLDEYNEKQKQLDLHLSQDVALQAKQYYDHELTSLQKEMKSELMKTKLQLQHQLIENRNHKCDEIFDEVKKQMIDFLSSKEYLIWLKVKLNQENDAMIYVNQFTYDCIKDEYHNCKVKDMLGGCIIERSNNIVFDYSFESLLNEQKEWFYMHSDLMIK